MGRTCNTPPCARTLRPRRRCTRRRPIPAPAHPAACRSPRPRLHVARARPRPAARARSCDGTTTTARAPRPRRAPAPRRGARGGRAGGARRSGGASSANGQEREAGRAIFADAERSRERTARGEAQRTIHSQQETSNIQRTTIYNQHIQDSPKTRSISIVNRARSPSAQAPLHPSSIPFIHPRRKDRRPSAIVSTQARAVHVA